MKIPVRCHLRIETSIRPSIVVVRGLDPLQAICPEDVQSADLMGGRLGIVNMNRQRIVSRSLPTALAQGLRAFAFRNPIQRHGAKRK